MGTERPENEQNQQICLGVRDLQASQSKDRVEVVAVLSLLREHGMQIPCGACIDIVLLHDVKEFPVPSLAQGTGPEALRLIFVSQ